MEHQMTLQEELRAYASELGLAPDDPIDILEVAANRIDALEAALREIGDCVGVLSPHAIRIQVANALRESS